KLAYISIINHAKSYVYIATPYLVLDNEMITALCLAAKSGIDVRIITPKIPDKWYVHFVTRSNYPVLIKAGVKIYEYSPGFIHSKTIVADDDYAIVGTANFDFRSFYLHFENGVFMYKSKAVQQVTDDYLNILDESTEITLDTCNNTPIHKRILRSILRLFSPLM
ncbi:MAG: cardiolipin synthase, partial [Clostridiales bacterium]|nr:cardiolipin synthase [Clostridiales bacterium]